MEKQVSSLLTFIYLDLYKFLNGLTADGAFIGLNPQFFCTVTAHTLEKTNEVRINNCSLKSEKLEVCILACIVIHILGVTKEF